jgi:Holliday junction resolvase RusA-like endonuclease
MRLDIEIMPPSSNHQYIVFQRHGKVRHAASPKLKEFQKYMLGYPKLHAAAILDAKLELRPWIKDGLPLSCDATFYFHHGSLFCRDGSIKKLDVSNRIKALHDCICKMLGMDDSQFFCVRAVKKSLRSFEKMEHVVIEIHPL